MQKRKISVLSLIYGAAILIGITFSWLGIIVSSVFFSVFWWGEFIKIPYLAPASTWTRRRVEYARPIFTGIILMYILGFLSHHFGWQHILAVLGHTFLRQ